MEKQSQSLDLGMLCRCCDCRSYELPKLEGFTEREVQKIQDLCKLCVESSGRLQ